MYSLEYKMILQVLRQLGSSGEFHADLSPQAALRDGGYVVLRVQNGNVLSCFIFNRNGQKLYHDAEAHILLPKFGVLDWQLVSSAPAKPAMPKHTTGVLGAKTVQRGEGFIPQRRMVPPDLMRTWSTLERYVYSLVDGTRTVEQIATLLSRPKQIIEQIVHNFELSGVIEWRRR
jgi:hypothetical protein